MIEKFFLIIGPIKLYVIVHVHTLQYNTIQRNQTPRHQSQDSPRMAIIILSPCVCTYIHTEHFFFNRGGPRQGHLMKQETKNHISTPRAQPPCRHINLAKQSKESAFSKKGHHLLQPRRDGLVILLGKSSAYSIASANQGDQHQLIRRHRCFVPILEPWLGVGGGQSKEGWLCMFLLLALQAKTTAEATW